MRIHISTSITRNTWHDTPTSKKIVPQIMLDYSTCSLSFQGSSARPHVVLHQTWNHRRLRPADSRWNCNQVSNRFLTILWFLLLLLSSDHKYFSPFLPPPLNYIRQINKHIISSHAYEKLHCHFWENESSKSCSRSKFKLICIGHANLQIILKNRFFFSHLFRLFFAFEEDSKSRRGSASLSIVCRAASSHPTHWQSNLNRFVCALKALCCN